MRFPTSLTQKRGSLCAAVSTAVAEATLLKSSLKSVCTVCRVKRISGWPAVTPAGHMVRHTDLRQPASSLSFLSRLYSRRDAAFLKYSDSPRTPMAYTVTVWLIRGGGPVVEGSACAATLHQIPYDHYVAMLTSVSVRAGLLGSYNTTKSAFYTQLSLWEMSSEPGFPPGPRPPQNLWLPLGALLREPGMKRK